jgi:hypothetical protein
MVQNQSPRSGPGRDLIHAPDDLVAIERLEVLGHPVRDALPLNRHHRSQTRTTDQPIKDTPSRDQRVWRRDQSGTRAQS